MLNKGLFTSARGNWRTPRELYATLDAEFYFDDGPGPAPFPSAVVIWRRPDA